MKALRDEMCRIRGMTMDDDNGVGTWLGGKIKWGGMETNRACQWFHRFCGLLEVIG